MDVLLDEEPDDVLVDVDEAEPDEPEVEVPDDEPPDDEPEDSLAGAVVEVDDFASRESVR